MGTKLRATLLATTLVGCTTVESTSVDASASPAKEQVKVESDARGEAFVLVGMVHEGGTRTCDEAGNESWVGRFWAVGFTPVVHDAALGETLAKLEGRVVAVEGDVTTAAPTPHGEEAAPASAGRCHEMQMRSDWELWPKGIRSRRGDEPDVGTLEVRSVTAVEPLRAKAEGDEVLFGVTNPFSVPLENATLIAQYEGCYGKPGSTAQRRPLGTIAAGAKLDDIPVPRIDLQDGPRGREHRLSSVRVRATVEGGAIDLDVPVAALGVTVECPDDGRK